MNEPVVSSRLPAIREPEITVFPPAPRKRRSFVPLLMAVILIAAFLVWRAFLAAPAVHMDVLHLSGRIEGEDSVLSPRTGGQIVEIRVNEGEAVKAGDIIAILEDEQLKGREEEAQSSLGMANTRLRAAKSQIAILLEQLTETELRAKQSTGDAEGRVRQAQAELAAAQSDLTQQEATSEVALYNKANAKPDEQSQSAANQMEATVALARKRVEAAKESLRSAKDQLANPDIHQAEAAGIRRQMAQQEAEISNTAASVETAKSQLAEAQENSRYLTVTAPFNGIVTTVVAEAGDVVSAGNAIATVLDLDKVYLRGFVSERQVRKIKVGRPARVYIDSYPNQPIDASVVSIDPKGESPGDDRGKKMVGVKLKLKLESIDGFAKPGMPAIGEVLVDGGTWPIHQSQ